MFIKIARIADMTEEEIILEQSLEVPTVAARREEGKAEETCPVCYELFNQIYKQVSGIQFIGYFFARIQIPLPPFSLMIVFFFFFFSLFLEFSFPFLNLIFFFSISDTPSI